MKELNVENKLRLRIFVNGTPNMEQMPKQDADSLITSLTNCVETNICKNYSNNIFKPVDINDST